jgi:hypothetical protein
MEEYDINPDRAMLLYDTGNGWEIAKLGKYAMRVVNQDGEHPDYYFAIKYSLFYRAAVPEELLEQIRAVIPTEEQLNSIEWIQEHQADVINYGTEMCRVRIEH